MKSEELPKVPVPSIVRQSVLPEPSLPVLASSSTPFSEGEEKGRGNEEVGEEEAISEGEEKEKGTILIKLYENSPFSVTFEGKIGGGDVDRAWRALMKQYRVWKSKLSKMIVKKKGE